MKTQYLNYPAYSYTYKTIKFNIVKVMSGLLNSKATWYIYFDNNYIEDYSKYDTKQQALELAKYLIDKKCS